MLLNCFTHSSQSNILLSLNMKITPLPKNFHTMTTFYSVPLVQINSIQARQVRLQSHLTMRRRRIPLSEVINCSGGELALTPFPLQVLSEQVRIRMLWEI